MDQTDLLINKLGSKYEEIRGRALYAIKSKLELGMVTEAELLDHPDLCSHLLNCVKSSSRAQSDSVLQFISRLCRHPNGIEKFKRIDPHFTAISTAGVPAQQSVLDQILNTPVGGEMGESTNDISGSSLPWDGPRSRTRSPFQFRVADVYLPTAIEDSTSSTCSLGWKPLNWALPELEKSDLSVLTTVYNSLRGDFNQRTQAASFFSCVILQDFPPHVFLHKKSILTRLLEILEKDSSNEHILKCVNDLSEELVKYARYCYDSAVMTPSCFVAERQRSGSESTDSRASTDLKGSINATDYCGLLLEKIPYVMPKLEPLLKLCVSDPETFWSLCHVRTTPLKHGITTALSSLAHRLLRNKCSDALEKLKTQILFVRLMKAAIPPSVATTVAPIDVQEAVVMCLLDPVLHLLFPKVLADIELYAKAFKYQQLESHILYLEVVESLLAGANFLNGFKSMPLTELIDTFEKAIQGLEFHQEYKMVSFFIEHISEKIDLTGDEIQRVETITVQLMASPDVHVRAALYEAVCNIVQRYLGPQSATSNQNPFPHLSFVLKRKVIMEIICFGLTSEHLEIRTWSENILVFILKCQILVAESSWLELLLELRSTFPLLHAFASFESSLGRTVLAMLDPDRLEELKLSQIEGLKGNIRLMMSKELICREEGTSRVIYLLGIPTHLEMTTNFNLFKGSAFTKENHFPQNYEEGSLIRVLDVISSQPSDVPLFKSVFSQLALIMEDPKLHIPFLERKGLEIIRSNLIRALESLDEHSQHLYSNILTVYWRLARHNDHLRFEFSQDYDLFCAILTGVFMFKSDWRLLQHAAQLLALMVYSDVVKTTSSVSFPKVLFERCLLPFEEFCHGQLSEHAYPSSKGLLDDKTMQMSLGVIWLATNSEKALSDLNVSKVSHPPLLPVSTSSIQSLTKTHLVSNVDRILLGLSFASSHSAASQFVSDLRRYLDISRLTGYSSDLSCSSWENGFSRYLTTLPASGPDQVLLTSILRFLNELIRNVPGQSLWITKIVQDPNLTLNSLINGALVATDEITKNLSVELFSLIKICFEKSDQNGWEYVVQSLMQCLMHSHTQKFYSIAVMDKLLGCLLTAADLKMRFKMKPLWQLLNAFHCEDPKSFMGLTVTRLTVLCLNKLLPLRLKNCEPFWKFPETKWLQNLVESRDLVVKSSSLELLSGLCFEAIGCHAILSQFPEVLDLAMKVLLDERVGCIAREMAANLCCNITFHSTDQAIARTFLDLDFFKYITLLSTKYFSDSDNTTGTVVTSNLISSCCRLTQNLIDICDEVASTPQFQGLVSQLFREVTGWKRWGVLDNQERVYMCTEIFKILVHFTDSSSAVNESVPVLVWLLQPSTYGDSVDKNPLVAQTLLMLATIASTRDTVVLLTKESVDMICTVIESNDKAMQFSVSMALPHLTRFLSSNDGVRVVERLGKCRKSHRLILSGILSNSHAGTTAALNAELLTPILLRLKETQIHLAVLPPDTPRNKKANAVLRNLAVDLGLLTNFLAGCREAKETSAKLGLADIIHKLWAWCLLDSSLLCSLLQVLITFTANFPPGAATILYTSTIAGVGLRKTPTSNSLLHVVISLLENPVYPLEVERNALELLCHACQSPEARTILTKTNILNIYSKVLSKKKISEELEREWLLFLRVYTSYAEGQSAVMKSEPTTEQIIEYFTSNKKTNLIPLSLSIIRNLSLNPGNRQKFIVSERILRTVSDHCLSPSLSHEELRDVLVIAWSVSANNQKGKQAVRNSNLETRIQPALGLIPSNDAIAKLASQVISLLRPS